MKFAAPAVSDTLFSACRTIALRSASAPRSPANSPSSHPLVSIVTFVTPPAPASSFCPFARSTSPYCFRVYSAYAEIAHRTCSLYQGG